MVKTLIYIDIYVCTYLTEMYAERIYEFYVKTFQTLDIILCFQQTTRTQNHLLASYIYIQLSTYFSLMFLVYHNLWIILLVESIKIHSVPGNSSSLGIKSVINEILFCQIRFE